MTHALKILALLGFVTLFDVQGQGLQLAAHRTRGVQTLDFNQCLARGENGAIYTAGVYNGTLIEDSDTLVTGFTDAIYVAKYNNDLSLAWIHTIAENRVVVGAYRSTVAVEGDGEGNLVLGISYTDVLYFFGDSVGYESAEGIQVLKLDQYGDLIWSKSIEGELLGHRGVDIGPTGDVFLTGVSSGDVFTERLTSDGILVWRRIAGGPNRYDSGQIIAIDQFSNTYISGYLYPTNSVYFDSIHPTFPLTAHHVSFVAKYDPMGLIQWVRHIYSTSFGNLSVFRSMTFDPDGNLLLAGSYADSQLRFSNGASPVGDQLAGYPQSFLTAYAGDGNRLWVKVDPYLGTGYDSSIDIDRRDSTILVLNEFYGSVASGSASISNYGFEDLRIRAFDLLGNWISDFQIGGTSAEVGRDLLVHNEAVFVLGGSRSHPLRVGEVLVEHPDPTSIFLLKLLAGSTGVRDLIEGEAFRVFPNPNQGAFFVEEMPPATAYTITDPTGRVVHTGLSERNGTTAVHLPDTSHGVYLMRFQVNGAWVCRRVMVVD
jgi:hypothetical protein